MRRLAPVVAVVTAVGLALLPAVSAGAASRLQPRPDEWWFSTWKIQQRVWPLSEGSGATVAVLDTGVQAGVPDLAGAVLPGGNVAGGGGDGRTDVDTQTDGHGTAMSVLIAGRGGGTGMVGIAPRARILPVVVNHNGSAGLTISAGIRFAVDHGAKVISISQGVPGAPGPICDVGVQQAVAYAVEHDVVVVASAGDTGNTASDYPQWPASCAGVLAVGGIEPDGSPWSGTQRQPYVDVAGPGDRVGWSGKDGKYIADSYGTSGAAALVSAALALVRARYPSMPARQVVQRLIDTAVPLGPPVPNDLTGYGLVDIHRALDVSTYPVAATAPNPPYAAFDRWRASYGARQSGPAGPSASRSNPAAAGSSGSSEGGNGIPIVIIAAFAVVAILMGIVLYAARRGRNRRRATLVGPPYPGPPYPGQPHPGTRPYPGPYPGQTPPYPGAGPHPGAAPPPGYRPPPGQPGHGPPPGQGTSHS